MWNDWSLVEFLETKKSQILNILKIRGKRFAKEIDDVAQRDIKKVKLGNDDEDINTPSRIKFETQLDLFLTSHKLILTSYKFGIILSKVISGFKSLKNTLNIRYSEIVNEIKTHEKEQRILTSLGITLKTITMYWIEKEIMSTKVTEFVDDPICEPVSKKADALVTDLIYNIDVMNMESSGGPFQQDRKHTFKDSEISLILE
ncbi:1833_t:CDS:2 [Funneliformis mosseae]|uniref:1833_t:CDS:1 n=1 Tax=Funneliformis mosseae TaxID=27381 RepID=A0A9N9CG51_FUNMO|nr:1833_t:CDS:2 [Funneliformis mosseae]